MYYSNKCDFITIKRTDTYYDLRMFEGYQGDNPVHVERFPRDDKALIALKNIISNWIFPRVK